MKSYQHKSWTDGRLITNGVRLEPHEFSTVAFLLDHLPFTIELIPPSLTPRHKNSDLLMDNIFWEMKGPVKSDAKAIERLFHAAATQSGNAIFDLRRIKGDDNKAIAVLEKCFNTSRRMRRMMIITKSEDLLIYKK